MCNREGGGIIRGHLYVIGNVEESSGGRLCVIGRVENHQGASVIESVEESSGSVCV